MPTFDRWDMIVRVSAVVAAAVGVALPGGWRRPAAPLARRPWLAAAVVAALSLAVNATVAWQHGMPVPRVHDEFSYLLAADTFAHGRLSNATPACADSFQSPHVLVRPTYASKYPPGQAVTLAVGLLLGHPVFGVWLTCAAASVAVWWMLLAFVPAEWALLGGVAMAVHPLMVDWGHVYWGGGAAVLGGALVLGGWGRLITPERPPLAASQTKPVGTPGPRPGDPQPRSRQRQTRAIDGFVLGLGLVVLASTRPYEGLIFSLPLLASLCWRRPSLGTVVPLLAILAVGGGLTATYDYAVTGQALRMPFAEYAAQFDVYSKFWFLPERLPPAYPNAAMAAVHAVKERGRYDLLRTWPAGSRRRSPTRAGWSRCTPDRRCCWCRWRRRWSLRCGIVGRDGRGWRSSPCCSGCGPRTGSCRTTPPRRRRRWCCWRCWGGVSCRATR